MLVKKSEWLSGLKIRPPLVPSDSRPPVVAEASEVWPVWRSWTKTLSIDVMAMARMPGGTPGTVGGLLSTALLARSLASLVKAR